MPIQISIFEFIVFSILLSLLVSVIHYINIKYPNKYAYQRFCFKHKWQIALTLLSSLLLFLLFLPLIVISVPYGKAAVVWSRFNGGTQDRVYHEGAFIMNPFNKYFLYNIKYQSIDNNFEAMTKGGLQIKIHVVTRFRLYKNTLPELQSNVGANYIKLLIEPQIAGWTRNIIANYTAEEVYTTKRIAIQNAFREKVSLSTNFLNYQKFGEKKPPFETSVYLELESIFLKRITLPPQVKDAIEAKLKAFYLNQEYLHKISIAKREAARKEEEARGIAKFQEIVSGGISDTYLRWRGIEATIQLSKSDNTKVVVIGGGKDGLPLILNTESQLMKSKPPSKSN
jgi:regulator of protease activity HflC (stomatin/prohibitin superfamily)